MQVKPQIRVLSINEAIPAGWEIVKDEEKQQFEPQIKELLSHQKQIDLQSGQIVLIIRKNFDIEIKIIQLKEKTPNGWRQMTIKEAQLYKQQLTKLLSNWSIVALDYGKIDGMGYGNVISTSYGPECGEKAIIRID